MDDIGTCTVEQVWGGAASLRIRQADRRIRIARGLIDAIRNGDIGPHAALDGDVLTIRDDYGQRVIYRIRWDDYRDGGHLAEWPD